MGCSRNRFLASFRQMAGYGMLRIRLAVFVALLVPMLMLLGCGGQEPTTAPTEAPGVGQPKTGGTLRVALAASTNTLDPALTVSSQDIVTSQQAYDNLVLIQPNLTLKPMLAESWFPNDELTQWTFKLRPGVKFHHGKTLDAEDVVFTFKRLLDPETGSPARATLDFIRDVVAVDSLTVRFVLDAPNTFLPESLSQYQARIVPSDVDPSKLATQEFGTGPFVITAHLPGERTVFRRNADYWEEGRPYVDGLVYFYMPEPETRVEALKTGSVDVVFPLEAISVDGVESSPGSRVADVASASYLTIVMDTTKPPFDNKKVRQAVQAATDRDAIRKAALLGRGEVANDHPIPPNEPNYWQGQQIVGYDVEKAKALLREAGYPDGLDLTLHTSTVGQGMVEMAVTFKESAAPAGIRVSIKRQPEDIYWSIVWMVEPFVTSQWNGRDADQALSIAVKGDAKWNEAKFAHSRIDELILKARGQADTAARKESYAEIQRILIDEVPRLIPVFRPVFVGLRDNVRGVEAHPNNWLILSDAWLDQ